jgi:hypothetical protein
MVTDVRSPGGWLTLLNSRIARWLVVGALATTGGGGAVAVYGTLQGAQAEHYCEFSIPSATTDTVAASCLNPLPNGITGAILPIPENIIYVNEVPAPVTRLNIGTAASASTAIKGTSTLSNVASGVVLSAAKELFTLANTGALTANGASGITPILLAPRDDTNGKRYLNFTWTRAGSGQTVSGEDPVLVRIKIVPCTLDGVGC